MLSFFHAHQVRRRFRSCADVMPIWKACTTYDSDFGTSWSILLKQARKVALELATGAAFAIRLHVCVSTIDAGAQMSDNSAIATLIEAVSLSDPNDR